MTAAETPSEECLHKLVKEYSHDHASLLEFLCFWGRHPSTRFDRTAILHSLDGEDTGHVQVALAYLVHKEVILMNTQTRVAYYQLTEAEPLRSELLALTRHDWSQLNRIQKKLFQRGEVYA